MQSHWACLLSWRLGYRISGKVETKLVLLVVLVTHIQTLSSLKLEPSGAVCCVCSFTVLNILGQDQGTKSTPIMFSVKRLPGTNQATNWSTWDSGMKIYRAPFFSQNFFAALAALWSNKFPVQLCSDVKWKALLPPLAGTKRIAREEQAEEETDLFDLKQTRKKKTLGRCKSFGKKGLWRCQASWYWKWVVEPRHSFQKETGQDLSNPSGITDLPAGGSSALL